MRGAREVTAVDVSRRAVADRAAQRAAERREGPRACAATSSTPVGDQRFDAIVSNPPYVPSEDDELPTRGPAARLGRRARRARSCSTGSSPAPTTHLRPGGFILLTHSSLLGTERTIADLEDARPRGRVRRAPPRPARPAHDRARPARSRPRACSPPASATRTSSIIRGRKPARASTWTSGAAAGRALRRLGLLLLARPAPGAVDDRRVAQRRHVAELAAPRRCRAAAGA